MHWIVYVSLIFGLFLLLMGAIILGSVNKLDKSCDGTPKTNAKRTAIGVLVVGVLMFVLSLVALFVHHKGAAVMAKISIPPQGQSMRRYYF